MCSRTGSLQLPSSWPPSWSCRVCLASLHTHDHLQMTWLLCEMLHLVEVAAETDVVCEIAKVGGTQSAISLPSCEPRLQVLRWLLSLGTPRRNPPATPGEIQPRGLLPQSLGRLLLWRDLGRSLPPPMALRASTLAGERQIRIRPSSEQADRGASPCAPLNARAAINAAGRRPQAAMTASVPSRKSSHGCFFGTRMAKDGPLVMRRIVQSTKSRVPIRMCHQALALMGIDGWSDASTVQRSAPHRGVLLRQPSTACTSYFAIERANAANSGQ